MTRRTLPLLAAVVLGPLFVLSPVLAGDPELRIPEAEARKAALEKPVPVYPPMARQLKVTGKVVIEAIVDESGAVGEVRVVTGNAMLARPATEVVKKWKFRPFLADGKPAPAVVSLSFEFL